VKRALVRANLAFLVILATPAMSLAADSGGGDTLLEWFFRLLRWTAGGWHNY
jgi:hypothetical protein